MKNKSNNKEKNMLNSNIKQSNVIDSEELDAYDKNSELNVSNYDEKLDLEESKILDFGVILLGDSNSGKTSIVNKFIDGTFSNKIKCTIDIGWKLKNLKIDKNLYAKLNVYDTAGQERYRSLTKSFYNKANGIILVFDLSNEKSFSNLNSWMKEINDNTGNVEIILVGNKSDLENRQVTKTKAENYAKDKNLKYIETSAKEGTNILLLFEELSIGMNKRKNEESSSNVDLYSIDTYVFRRENLNKELKREKEAKCC